LSAGPHTFTRCEILAASARARYLSAMKTVSALPNACTVLVAPSAPTLLSQLAAVVDRRRREWPPQHDVAAGCAVLCDCGSRKRQFQPWGRTADQGPSKLSIVNVSEVEATIVAHCSTYY